MVPCRECNRNRESSRGAQRLPTTNRYDQGRDSESEQGSRRASSPAQRHSREELVEPSRTARRNYIDRLSCVARKVQLWRTNRTRVQFTERLLQERDAKHAQATRRDPETHDAHGAAGRTTTRSRTLGSATASLPDKLDFNPFLLFQRELGSEHHH